MNDHISKINAARSNYKPAKISCLFIAESPPSEEDRFFYFEEVNDQDSLYLEMMKALFHQKKRAQGGSDEIISLLDHFGPSALTLRSEKTSYLEKFREKGFYLIDCIDHPMPSHVFRTKDKIKYLEQSQNVLADKVSGLVDKKTPIVLISVPVFQAMAGTLKYKGFNVINIESIPFPGSGQQTDFQSKMNTLLNEKLSDLFN